MSDYIGSGVALLLIAAAIAAVLFAGGTGGGTEASIIPEATAAVPGPDYGWRVAAPEFGDSAQVAEFY